MAASVCQLATGAWLDDVTRRTVLLGQTFASICICSDRALGGKDDTKKNAIMSNLHS